MRYLNSLKIRCLQFYYNYLLGKFGKHSYIRSVLKITGPRNIFIGNNTYIGYKAWLAGDDVNGTGNCKLQIGNHVSIGNFNHIYATKSIVIEDSVLTADKVYISDNLHSYQDIHIPVKLQPIKQISEVVIGSGSWIGENACVMGAKIGRNCVVGANAVVTMDIPDYCVVVGIPAKIIKRYCLETNEWKKTSPDGIFIV
jgi:acetyltransferase-like isoleucine patch superfamily enzyme